MLRVFQFHRFARLLENPFFHIPSRCRLPRTMHENKRGNGVIHNLVILRSGNGPFRQKLLTFMKIQLVSSELLVDMHLQSGREENPFFRTNTLAGCKLWVFHLPQMHCSIPALISNSLGNCGPRWNAESLYL